MMFHSEKVKSTLLVLVRQFLLPQITLHASKEKDYLALHFQINAMFKPNIWCGVKECKTYKKGIYYYPSLQVLENHPIQNKVDCITIKL
jgi:hypothetical protein